MLLPTLFHDKFCWSYNRIYIKANGRVPCWCDNGETHTVVDKDFSSVDFITDIVNASEMRKMRLDILESNKQYIPECKNCSCFLTAGNRKFKRYHDSELANDVQQQAESAYKWLKNVSKTRDWPLGSIDKISEIQLESSFPCGLKCPACIHGIHPAPLSTEKPPYFFPLAWFQHMIDCANTHNVEIKRIQYCGKGEPTLNKALPEMIKYAHKCNIAQSIDTNANQDFDNDYLLLDRINCSIDGSSKESYGTYRRKGNWDKAVHFMRTAAEAKRQFKSDCLIRWKYILFDSTESVEQLNAAQLLAKELGIDELDFVITACGSHDLSVLPPQKMNSIDIVKSYLNDNKIFPNAVTSRS